MSQAMQLDDSLVNRAAPPASMRYFCLLYTPLEHRDALTALFAIDAEIRESARSASHDVAHTRLRWWRAEIDRLVNREPQHPASRVLLGHPHGTREVFSRLHELLVAADMDLARMTYQSAAELRAYCARSGATITTTIAELLVGEQQLDENARTAVVNAGIGIRQAEILRDIRQDVHEGRLYLPLDRLEAAGLRTEDLAAPEPAANVRAVLSAFREDASAELHPPSLATQQHSALRPIWVLRALHQRLLERIAARDHDVASERIELGAIEKPWVAWRAARSSR